MLFHWIHLFVVVKTFYYVNLILFFYGNFTVQYVTRNIDVVSKECCYPNNMYFYSNVKIFRNNLWTDDSKNDIFFSHKNEYKATRDSVFRLTDV